MQIQPGPPQTGTLQTKEDRRPWGFVPLGLFFLFGAIMAAYAAFTLLRPGTALDGLWAMNANGHVRLLQLGKGAGIAFAVLSSSLSAATLGWFRRRYWGWALGTAIIALNAAGDFINGVMGERLKAAVGVAIAAALLLYLTRDEMRRYFRRR